ncbi:MAG TPA: oxygen-dependent coproporphyrinogen oxidase [Polyangia bacterium]|jgi:coproporphyrinogen III oxidase
MTEPIEARAETFFRELQQTICGALETEDGTALFRADEWQRPGGGGGISRVLTDGALFEKAGVNFSSVHGQLKPDFAGALPGDGLDFFASGISLVLHPKSPMVPTVHANFRVLRRGEARWFGGGADLTPYYPEREDAVHFHRAWKTVCDRHDPTFYPRFKKWCDEYFYLPHRQETRGIGGIFFDTLQRDAERDFAFVRDAGATFLEAYLPIVRRRRELIYGDRERSFQLLRRGRYVEFNLLYDRGTTFGLKTDGRTESILMSLPPLVRWEYDARFPPGSREAQLADWLKPQEWL